MLPSQHYKLVPIFRNTSNVYHCRKYNNIVIFVICLVVYVLKLNLKVSREFLVDNVRVVHGYVSIEDIEKILFESHKKQNNAPVSNAGHHLCETGHVVMEE